MKKPLKSPKPKTKPFTELDIQPDEIFKALDMTERTQKPPSEELISMLNQLASKPPFIYTQKITENGRL